MIADLVAAAVRLELVATTPGGGAEHYVAYLDLVIRSLLRPKCRFPEAAKAAVEKGAHQKTGN